MSVPIKLQWFLMIFIIAGTIILIGINIAYTTTEQYMDIENYTEKIPYDVTENYTDKEAYTVPMYRGYLINEDTEKGMTYILGNVTSYSYNYTGKNIRGQDEYTYRICYQFYCYDHSNITYEDIETEYVTKYREIQKSHQVTKYEEIQKSRAVNKTRYINLSILQRILKNKNSTGQ
ncbi:Uncharacterised protein [uncultured archaeon]|nr:Uncharacterised protein [uncultured archaeon]